MPLKYLQYLQYMNFLISIGLLGFRKNLSIPGCFDVGPFLLFILKHNFLYTHRRPNTIDQPGQHSTSVSRISQKAEAAHCIISFAA